VVYQVGRVLQLPLALDRRDFERHYLARLALPYTVVRNLTPEQIARFEEQPLRMPGLDIEVQSTRTYPHNGTAAHIVGALRRDDSSTQGEESFFSYRMADYRGELGVEWGFDRYLRGVAGAKSVLVNNVGYRQTEHIWSDAEPGSNVVLTVDMRVQEAAEKALHRGPQGANTAGAIVVMDVNTGDILAMVSSPTLNPNHYVQGFPRGEWKRITDIHAQKNRATQENYAPGSIFKTLVGLAALENGLDPHATVTAVANPRKPSASLFMLGKRGIRDTAPPGPYDFRRAMKLSSNTYFITQGLRTGPEKIIELARKFHLGERAGLSTRQETSGYIPPLDRVRTRWTDGNTANLSIGQDPILVTPLQIAVMTSAIANGGKVLWPRLVQRVEPVDPFSEQRPIEFPGGRVRDNLGVKQRSMAILHQAMLADTEDSDGTGRHVRDHVPLEGFRICAKTGTAQVQDENNAANGQTTWFAAFGPFEKPRYAVVVMVENGFSGGGTCAPIAGLVFDALLAAERPATDFRASLEGKEAGS
jgi:penicillin-binding protein 2